MELSVQTLGVIEKVGLEAGYSMIAQAGFTAIDWGIEAIAPNSIRKLEYKGLIYGKPLEEIIAYFAPQLEYIRKNNLKITQAHAPFPAYVPGHPEVLEFMIGAYKRCIEFCDYAGCENVVIHGISLSNDNTFDTPESIEAMNWHLYESLIPTLQKCNVTVCLENLFSWDTSAIEGHCSDPHEAVRFIDSLNKKAGKDVFGLCLDTGHLQLLGKSMRSYIPTLGKRIKALHVHDNDARIDRHLAPFTGKVDWASFCQELRAIGYSGDISFETFQQLNAACKLDKELIAPWLRLIYEIGATFRRHIQG